MELMHDAERIILSLNKDSDTNDAVIESLISESIATEGFFDGNIITRIFNAIKAFISRIVLSLRNELARILMTDQGFKKLARDAIAKNAPLQAIKFSMYDYNETFIQNELTKLSNVMLTAIGQSTMDLTKESFLDKGKSYILEVILKSLGSINTTDTNAYLLYIKDKYRGNKEERLFKGSDTNMIYRIATSGESTNIKSEAILKAFSIQVAGAKNKLSLYIDSKEISRADKEIAIRRFANINHLLNFFNSVSHLVMGLNFEKIRAYRTVFRRLYQV